MKTKKKKSPTTVKSYLPCYVYFVGFRVTTGDGSGVNNMILRVPGPIRDVAQLRKVEVMLAGAEKARLDEKKVGPRVIDGSSPRVVILTLNLLEVFEQELTEEELAMIRRRNEEVLRQQELQGKADEIVEELKGKPSGEPGAN